MSPLIDEGTVYAGVQANLKEFFSFKPLRSAAIALALRNNTSILNLYIRQSKICQSSAKYTGNHERKSHADQIFH
jgi:hypothetical protein